MYMLVAAGGYFAVADAEEMQQDETKGNTEQISPNEKKSKILSVIQRGCHEANRFKKRVKTIVTLILALFVLHKDYLVVETTKLKSIRELNCVWFDISNYVLKTYNGKYRIPPIMGPLCTIHT